MASCCGAEEVGGATSKTALNNSPCGARADCADLGTKLEEDAEVSGALYLTPP